MSVIQFELIAYLSVCMFWNVMHWKNIIDSQHNLLENPSGSKKEEDSDTGEFLVYQTQRYLFSYYETALSLKSTFIMMMQQPVRTGLHDK